MTLQTDTELDCLSRIADAELGVAEELGWHIAFLAGLSVHLIWENWLVTVVTAIFMYFVSVYRWQKKASEAEKAKIYQSIKRS